MRITQRVNLLVVLTLIGAVKAGLLRVPKIYNTVITSDGNLEPSRAYPIVQSVLSVGVAAVQPVLTVLPQPVPVPIVPVAPAFPPPASVTSTPTSILKQTDARHLSAATAAAAHVNLGTPGHLYPIAIGGVYPLLATTNALYPTVLYHPQPVLAPILTVQQPVSRAGPAVRLENRQTVLEQQPQQFQQQQQQEQQQQQQPLPRTADVLNNTHRLKNPNIPDVPPPPLPVGANKNA